MIIRAPEATVGENKLTDLMLNLIDEHQIRCKLTLDGESFDFYIRNWFCEMRGLTINFVMTGIEVPTKLPVQLSVRYEVLKKNILIGGQFMKSPVRVRTTVGKLFEEFVKLLKRK